MFKPTTSEYMVTPNSYKSANDFIIWANSIIYDINFAISITELQKESLDDISIDIAKDINQNKIEEVECSYDVFN